MGFYYQKAMARTLEPPKPEKGPVVNALIVDLRIGHGKSLSPFQANMFTPRTDIITSCTG